MILESAMHLSHTVRHGDGMLPRCEQTVCHDTNCLSGKLYDCELMPCVDFPYKKVHLVPRGFYSNDPVYLK